VQIRGMDDPHAKKPRPHLYQRKQARVRAVGTRLGAMTRRTGGLLMRRLLLVLCVSIAGSAWTVAILEACGHSDGGSAPVPNGGPNEYVGVARDGSGGPANVMLDAREEPAIEAASLVEAEGGDDAGDESEVPTYGPCPADAGCGAGRLCAFKVADGCRANGTCVDVSLSNATFCATPVVSCGCDGSEVTVGCSELPSGWAQRPVASTGACGLSVAIDAATAPHSFTCGVAQCTAPTQYCKMAQPSGMLPTYSCATVPRECTGATACTCVEAQTGGQNCNSVNGEMTVTIR
jgi:hypothetical protein